MNQTHWTRDIPSPLGALRAVTDGHALTGLDFGVEGPASTTMPAAASELLGRVARELDEWFAGGRTTFDLPLAPQGTPFQQTVWTELRRIPYGATVSYAAIAQRIGQPSAVRAVGAANGRNPIAIVIPCHRVIGADGRLAGYAGGVARKQALLVHEAHHAFALQP